MKKIRKRILSVVASVLSVGILASSNSVFVDAYSGWDSNGTRWNYMLSASAYKTKDDFAWSLFEVKGETVNIYFDGCNYGSMIPYYSRALFGDNMARTYMTQGSHGNRIEAYCSAYSDAAKTGVKQSKNCTTRNIYCYNNTIGYQGYIYFD